MSTLKRILAAIVLSLSTFGTALAQTEGLTVSTAYPSQVVRTGETVSIQLELKIANLSAQIVQLDVRDVPDGWEATFQGAGRVVRSVYVEPDNTRNVTLNVKVPRDATNGSHRLSVIARGSGISATLPLELVVGDVEPAQISMEAELPVLKGTPNSNFSYRLKIKNEAEEDLLVNLDSEFPQGFEVTFKKAFGGQELTSVPVKAGQTESVDATFRPSDTVAAGEYPLRVRAQAGPASAEVDLTAVVTGKPDLSLSAPDGRLSARATAGRETPLDLVLKNSGSAPAENLRLEASPPAGWNIVFEPDSVPQIGPGEEVQIKAKITPSDKAVAGDYAVTLRVIPETGSSESAEFRITLVTSTLWGVVGLVLIAAALGVVALAVSRFGRR